MSNQISQHAEQLLISVGNKSVIAGASTTGASAVAAKTQVMGFLSMEGPEILNACAILGAVVAVAGFGVSTYFQWRRDKYLRTGQYPVVKAVRDE
ncbi:hypothetical protein [uncultured Gilvimarinus sp.]|uniref:hypothetical protein n=1 Tax=uncultured Gilvimarinus sp. TaxID=1689143 RepID=UPI0030DDD6D8